MGKKIRIGGACAFYGDSSVAPAQLIAAGVDYIILDYLAEATMSVLGNMRKRRPDLGYATDAPGDGSGRILHARRPSRAE